MISSACGTIATIKSLGDIVKSLVHFLVICCLVTRICVNCRSRGLETLPDYLSGSVGEFVSFCRCPDSSSRSLVCSLDTFCWLI